MTPVGMICHHSNMVWCFQCGAAYDEDVSECAECGVATFPTPPQPAEEVGGPDDEQLAYEFHEWSYDSRSGLEAALQAQELEHAWLGPTLIVCEADEEAVDKAVEEVLRGQLPAFDKSQPAVVYELGDFDDAHKADVVSELLTEGIAHEIDYAGNLAVGEADEEAVDALFDRLANAVAQHQFGPGLPDAEPYQVLEALFFSSDRLRRSAVDSKAVEDFAIAHDQVVQLSLPWGYDAEFWRAMLDAADALRVALAAGPDPVDGDAASKQAAEDLRELLRSYM
ncbi:hypothetical protein [Candidatus Poriferisocius sp.]|uniref:hypothetical protein n=1 Tax=Candidatus Poriferisocius sp. TaxID=3101276 RepID=UPI003B01EED7